MPLTIENAGALVGGLPATQEKGMEMKVKALRGFYVAGKEVKKGAEVTVPEFLGRDLLASKKAERVVDVEAPAEGKKKEAKNAG